MEKSTGQLRHGPQRCSRCHRAEPEIEFGSRKPDGTRQTWCKPCTSQFFFFNYSKRRDAIASVKLERGCTDCGYNTHPQALEFDHLPGYVKSFTISYAATRPNLPLERIFEEMEKCEVVCANCHRIRTADRKEAEMHAMMPKGGWRALGEERAEEVAALNALNDGIVKTNPQIVRPASVRTIDVTRRPHKQRWR